MIFSLLYIIGCSGSNNTGADEEDDKYDGPREAAEQMYEAMKDPATGKIPDGKLWEAIEYTEQLKQDLRSWAGISSKTTTLTNWVERGPDSDFIGVSNTNIRANNGVAAGRIRAIWVDLSDTTGNTVWTGGINGGLWKTTNITASPAGWTFVDDRFNNLSISSICQDPTNTNIMYFATGEPTRNVDAVRGAGVFKSTDHGVIWAQLGSTTSFIKCSKIICDTSGNVYLATIGSGLRRSANQGSTWTNIAATGFGNDYTDIQISSTTGTLHAVSGYNSALIGYHRTTAPATVTAGTWSTSTTPYTNVDRVIIACKGANVLLVPADISSENVINLYLSANDGVSWSSIGNVPAGASSGQGWYCLAADIDPSNVSNIILGGFDCFRTQNGGASAWTQVSTWKGTTPVNQYVHADQQYMYWYNAGAQSRILIAGDGGVFLSTDGGTSWADKNVGLRIKQFYSCDINPNAGSNILLAGAQDNGVHQFSLAGLGASAEVTGGDGMYVHIDQNQPQFMFGSYVFNQYRVSNNTGASWNRINFSASAGLFINPTDYDDTANIMYCCDALGSYRRWTDPQVGSTSEVVSISTMAGARVTAVTVNPYKSGSVYFGTNTGKVVKVTAADVIASGSAGTDLSAGLPGGTIHSIVFGSDSNHITVTYTNYNINNVWVSTNGGATWTGIDNNLPNMPVWWALYDPASNDQLYLGTETGVWSTALINGASTIWVPEVSFPNVSTQMLKLRPVDNTVVAATHGRGLWTATLNVVPLPLHEFSLTAVNSGQQIALKWTYLSNRHGILFNVETSDDGIHFKSAKTVVQDTSGSYACSIPFTDEFIRIKAYDTYGFTEYSRTIRVKANNHLSALILRNLHPNPVKDVLSFTADIPAGAGLVTFRIYDLRGRVVYQNNNNGKTGIFQADFTISALPAGQYILQASSSSDNVVDKFIKL